MLELPKILTGKTKLPMHLAINTSAISVEGATKHFELIDQAIDYQQKNEIRVLSIKIDNDQHTIASMKAYFNKLLSDARLAKTRVFIIGQWYDIDLELTETFKQLMEKTKTFDQYFLSFLVRYDGQDEILTSLKLALRKIVVGKMKEEDLNAETIKENLYNSYFPPPQLIIETSTGYSSMMLWDSKSAVIFYAGKPWISTDKKDLDAAIAFWTKMGE